jgi:hypothetical protein
MQGSHTFNVYDIINAYIHQYEVIIMTITLASNQRLTCSELPQANNLWRIKGLLQSALGGVLLQRATIDAAFDNSRDRQYYMDAMSKTLGWVERNGVDFSVTPAGAAALQAASVGDATFAHTVHSQLLAANAFYAQVSQGAHLVKITAAMADEFGIAMSTAERRATCVLGWFSDLQAARMNNTQPILGAKIAARSNESKNLALNMWMVNASNIQHGIMAARTFSEIMDEQLFMVHGTACLVSGIDIPGISVACRIKPLDVCKDSEAIDLHNGLVLESRVATLFSRGLISFADDGSVKVSSRIPTKDLQRVGLCADSAMRVSPTNTMKTYLAYHRSNVFIR